MPRVIEAVVPQNLRFHPEWFTDPPPVFIWEKLKDRIDTKVLSEYVKKQVEVKNRVLAAQKAALKAEIELIEAQTELNELTKSLVPEAKGRMAASI